MIHFSAQLHPSCEYKTLSLPRIIFSDYFTKIVDSRILLPSFKKLASVSIVVLTKCCCMYIVKFPRSLRFNRKHRRNSIAQTSRRWSALYMLTDLDSERTLKLVTHQFSSTTTHSAGLNAIVCYAGILIRGSDGQLHNSDMIAALSMESS